MAVVSDPDGWKAGPSSFLTDAGPADADRGGASSDRYRWVIPLIAFAGLTAVFAGTRSGGRGLIEPWPAFETVDGDRLDLNPSAAPAESTG